MLWKSLAVINLCREVDYANGVFTLILMRSRLSNCYDTRLIAMLSGKNSHPSDWYYFVCNDYTHHWCCVHETQRHWTYSAPPLIACGLLHYLIETRAMCGRDVSPCCLRVLLLVHIELKLQPNRLLTDTLRVDHPVH